MERWTKAAARCVEWTKKRGMINYEGVTREEEGEFWMVSGLLATCEQVNDERELKENEWVSELNIYIYIERYVYDEDEEKTTSNMLQEKTWRGHISINVYERELRWKNKRKKWGRAGGGGWKDQDEYWECGTHLEEPAWWTTSRELRF